MKRSQNNLKGPGGRWIVSAAACAGLVVAALSPTRAAAPATRPVDPPAAPRVDAFPALIDALGSRDAAVRDAARESLMLLARDDLPALRDAARTRPPLRPTQRALLRDVVVQVYLAGKHHFAGTGPGYVGVSSAGTVGDGAAVVYSCTPGNDGYRVLRPGDQITALGRVTDADGQPETGALIDIGGFAQLRGMLDAIPVGQWVRLRVLRNGTEREQLVRLGPAPAATNVVVAPAAILNGQANGVVIGGGILPGVGGGLVPGINLGGGLLPPADDQDVEVVMPAMDEGLAYWAKSFAPLLAVPATTRPATTRPADAHE